MKNIKLNKITLSIILSATLLTVSGCTATNPYTGQQQISDTAVGTGLGAAGGAILGGLVGGERGAWIGAAAGGLTGAAVGYSLDQANADLRKQLVGTGVQVTEQGNTVQLRMASDVTFDTNSADIKASFYQTLDSVCVILRKYDRTSITISGYTDDTGTPSYNQTLSEKRARSVGAYLVSHGISLNRIFTKGFGERYPIATNTTTQGKALNRRVVITLRPLD